MINFIIRKILALIPMLVVISFLIFLGVELMPGDAVDFMISPEALSTVSPAELEALRDELGLNDPFIVRYFIWLANILRGDFGYSLQSGVPVSQLMANTLPATLELTVAALLISTLLGSLLGVVSALRKGSIADNVLTVAGMIGVAIPQFLFGLVMIVVFVFNLEWLPVGGRMTPGRELFFQRLEYLVLPAVVLGLALTAGVMRYSRASMLDSLNKDYIKTARSKGLKEWRINLIHGLRVAMTPVAVLIGFRLPMLIGGAVVIEQVFQWQGVGQLFVMAVRSQNTPIIMMIAFFSVLMVLVSSILVDIVTAILDPRVKLS
ncbi:MAG: peptide ABC transporter permease [Spirochaetae bacterium HGW-Spirochaetae-7]|nr:MAG: peptide ABC transporter permease [Spirochaetae bacterium HGW-Spirochaetae-7]